MKRSLWSKLDHETGFKILFQDQFSIITVKYNIRFIKKVNKFMLHIFAIIILENKAKYMPRVRIELTTFRL